MINTRTQKVEGDDTTFTIDLGQAYDCKRLVLNQFVMVNFFSNFMEDEQDFSYEIGAGIQQLTIKQVHLNTDQFKVYVEAQQANFTFTQYDKLFNKFVLQTSVNFAPRGKGWKKLGFTTAQLAAPLATVWNPLRYFDFSQSPVVYVRFLNIPNQYQGYDGQASFQLQNVSSFGGRLSTDNDNLISNQQIQFSNLLSIRKLQIQIEDCEHKKMQTQNNNDTGAHMYMSLSVYLE